MLIGVPLETAAGETRVAVTPETAKKLKAQGHVIRLQSGAGVAASATDEAYTAAGAEITDRAGAFACELVLKVRSPDADELSLMKPGTALVGMLNPFDRDGLGRLAAAGLTSFALEAAPRTTRAQSMDVLSSQANIGGYKAVMIAADKYQRLFPMLMTAAGTITPAKVLVLGAGVAGLQAIASSRRLGAVVQAYDVRAAVKEQIESLGAKFVELKLDTADAEDKGGYAKALTEEQVQRQREQLAEVVAGCDVVIATAAIPGKRSPLLVTADAVRRMAPGSVIVDLAAERGGNCELTRADETVVENGVTILGPTNLASDVPYHASQMFAKNVVTLLQLLTQKRELVIDLKDEVIRETLAAKDGQVQPPRLREALGLGPLLQPPEPAPINHLA